VIGVARAIYLRALYAYAARPNGATSAVLDAARSAYLDVRDAATAYAVAGDRAAL